MNLPKYPDDFFDFSDGVDVPSEQINKWIEEMINELEKNPDWNYHARSTGNTYIRVDRDEIAKYVVFVTKNYQEKYVY